MKTIEQIEKKKVYLKEYYLKNAEKLRAYQKESYLKNAEKKKAYHKQYALQNPEKIKAQKKEWRLQNPEKVREYDKNYRKQNPEKISAMKKKHFQKKYKEDPNYRLMNNLRARIRRHCNSIKLEKNFRTIEALGCTAQEFKEHLEGLFKVGMTWENYGLGGWVVDHIKPISLAKTSDEVYLLNHYTNLQPMWELDNLIKSNKYDEPTLQFHEPNEIDGFGEFLEEMLMLNQES